MKSFSPLRQGYHSDPGKIESNLKGFQSDHSATSRSTMQEPETKKNLSNTPYRLEKTLCQDTPTQKPPNIFSFVLQTAQECRSMIKKSLLHKKDLETHTLHKVSSMTPWKHTGEWSKPKLVCQVCELSEKLYPLHSGEAT